MPFRLQTITSRISPIRRIERSELSHQRRRRHRNLIARIPLSVIGPPRKADPIVRVAQTICHKPVELVVIIRMNPRSVVVIRLPAIKKRAQAQLLRCPKHTPRSNPSVPPLQCDKILRQRFVKFQMCRAHRTIIPHLRIIWPLLVIQPLHEFRNHRIHVRVTLAVRVRRQIQRHVIQVNRKIRSVIEIEAARKILVRLPARPRAA